jgi:hypothetical protein
MKEKEKRPNPISPQPPGTGDPAGQDLAAARQAMDELLCAGDAAIKAALSSDSAAFLAANQQRGGQ